MGLSMRGAMGMMQEAAIIHSDASGYSIKDVPTTGVIWMLIGWRIRLLDHVGWNENVTVKTWPRTMERLTSERDFEIVTADGRIAAIGESVWVLVNAQTGRIVRIHQDVVDAYDLSDRKVFLQPQQVIPHKQGTERYQCTVTKRDLDTNHHVNNRVYLDYAVQTMPDDISAHEFREISIRYRKQLLLADRVRCFYRDEETCHVVDICGEDQADIRATVVFYK